MFLGLGARESGVMGMQKRALRLATLRATHLVTSCRAHKIVNLGSRLDVMSEAMRVRYRTLRMTQEGLGGGGKLVFWSFADGRVGRRRELRG